jgi:hypothetical protein
MLAKCLEACTLLNKCRVEKRQQSAPDYTVWMTSITIEHPAVQIDRDLIRFTHPDEWQRRSAFRWSLIVTEHNLSHFVGGYNLPKELYQRCGLSHGGKPCNQEHGLGFLVATTEGLETQVGKDCGLRHLGAKFEELERLFTAAASNEDLTKRMLGLRSKAGEMLLRAQETIRHCDAASAAVSEMKQRINREPALADVFKGAVTSEGSVFAEVRVSDNEYEVTHKRYRREVFGRIDGIAAATAKSPKTNIQDVVLPLVHTLADRTLVGLSGKKLTTKLKEAADAERLLIEGDAFIAVCRRFTSRRNWESFALAFEPGRLHSSDRGHRLLKQLVESGT